MKLNIGSGEKKLPGFINVDKYPSQKGDLKGDLDKKINLTSGCAEEIMLDNVIEHVDSIPNTMKEIRRLLKKMVWCIFTPPTLQAIHLGETLHINIICLIFHLICSPKIEMLIIWAANYLQ